MDIVWWLLGEGQRGRQGEGGGSRRPLAAYVAFLGPLQPVAASFLNNRSSLCPPLPTQRAGSLSRPTAITGMPSVLHTLS